jgi:hypothetical protein
MGYVPELLNNSQYEGRGIYHFEFFYTESLPENIDTFCEVEIHGQYIETHSNPDPYLIFDPNPLNVLVKCDDTISACPNVITMWDDGDSTWDKPLTAWDASLL